MIEMKIRDEELLDFSCHASAVGRILNSRIENLKNCLQKVCEIGVSEGDFHNNLELYVALLDSLLFELNSKTAVCEINIMSYISTIDHLDGNLY